MAPQIPLHEGFLHFPAQSVLKALQMNCLGWEDFQNPCFSEHISSEAKFLLQGCQTVRKGSVSVTDISNLAGNQLLCQHVERISSMLMPDVLLKLSLLTWHFDASGTVSEDLLRFLTGPQNNEDVYKLLWNQYKDRSEHDVTLKVFILEMLRLMTFLQAALATRWNVLMYQWQ
ncbi:uncharacterized protein BO80DRAFT_471215 [Aspergillus ibericus CBS 121593]|uniref:Uncharacterized protein n=1 Tax=Aspergillus ibericus CBS 121593 TaxID=1448316 RepID=A0A395GHF6_9EURO|nr:hypothetical protein BO80DRAFT_471215 [Aspergillus ibericus CBS 121593]RAK94821.1 hypothetical protein BO80DRAFT_471215 [Aspergillus ibericus CBS 121593]